MLSRNLNVNTHYVYVTLLGTQKEYEFTLKTL